MSSVLQLPSKPVPKSFIAQNAAAAKFVELGLHGLSCTKNAGRFPRHLAINSILKGLLISPLPWSWSAGQMTEGGRMD